MRTLLTFIALSVILVPYMLYKFVCNPIGCIKQMIADWKFINGDWYDNPPAHSKTKEKKTKRQGKSITG